MTDTYTPINTGTAAATNGSTAVVFTGAGDMTVVANPGDMIVLAGVVYFIASITDAANIVLTRAYAGSTASGLTYEISARTNMPVQTSAVQRLNDYVARNAIALSGTADPTSGIGLDGQSYIKNDGTNPVTIWLRAAGSWAVKAFAVTSAAITSALGYTPVNKAGDTIAGFLSVTVGAGPTVALQSADVGAYLQLIPNNTAAQRVEVAARSSGAYGALWADGDWLTWDRSGHIAMPGQPALTVRKTDGGEYSSTGVLTFDNLIYSRGGSWTGSRFTAPVAGAYLVGISAHKNTTANLSSVRLSVLKNGGSAFECYSYAADRDRIALSGILGMAAGDYIEFALADGVIWAGDASGVTAYCNFMG